MDSPTNHAIKVFPHPLAIASVAATISLFIGLAVISLVEIRRLRSGARASILQGA